jgi:hypothetical protein
MAKKKTLYKIPTENEIQGAIPADVTPTTEEEKIVAKEKEVKPEVVEALPVKEPEPVARVNTADEKLEAARKADAEAKAKKAAAAEAKAAAMEAEKSARTKVDGFKPTTLRPPEMREFKPEKKKEPKRELVQDEEARQILRKHLDITQFEGFSVGGRNTVQARTERRVTRDRRRERIAKRESMKLMIAGEEQELSEASKYMLDMLIKNPRKEDQQ